ncbi:MAG: DUF5694 domain-containing protein [Pseudomonadota bacterium]
MQRTPNSLTVMLTLIASVAIMPTAFAENAEAPAQVMLIGVWHFANPGLDMVKTDVIDVATDENQAYLEGLTDRLAEFAPTAVLLEFDPADQQKMQARYNDYRAGNVELGINEIYQLGFRIAHKSDLNEIHSFDERTVQWLAEPMMARMESLPARKAEFEGLIETIGKDIAEQHRTMTMAQLLRVHNSQEEDRRNKDLYLRFNDVGVGEDFSGADATASWWHRNFRMYAHIQHHATPGERVLVIAGQGHTAILRDLLDLDSLREAVAFDPYID